MSPEEHVLHGESLDAQMGRLLRGTVHVEVREDLEKKLRRGRPLTVKVGFDPSSADLHLGHTVLMRKMRDFQTEGHRVVFVVGDFTGRIGDPSGRSKTRPQLTRDQVLANAKTYTDQCFRILDRSRTEICFNSEWLEALGATGLVELAARTTVARMLEREDFRKRFQDSRPIAVHEFLYPLTQAYDSVHLEADVELGGTDQLWNLLMGRDVMREYGLEPQVVVTVPLLVGLDGTEKMSKSLGNAIGVEEPPGEIYGKIMSVSDDMMWDYLLLLTGMAEMEVESRRDAVKEGTLHPKAVKMELARRVVAELHDDEAARSAEEEFERVFSRKEDPSELEEVALPARGRVGVIDAILRAGFARSRSEARRLVRGGGVYLDDERVTEETTEVRVEAGAAVLLRVGRHRFARLVFED